MYKWTLGVGAVNYGAELTRLGATDHGAEVPRSHNHLANLSFDVALGSAPWILAPRSAPPFSAPSPFYHRAKGAVNPFDRAVVPPRRGRAPSSLKQGAGAGRRRRRPSPETRHRGGAPSSPAPPSAPHTPPPSSSRRRRRPPAAAAAVVRTRPPRLSPRPPSPASALPRNQAPGPRPARRV